MQDEAALKRLSPSQIAEATDADLRDILQQVVAGNLRAQRDSLGMTAAQVADDICSTPELSAYENSHRLPNTLNLVRLAWRLQMTLDELIGVPSKETRGAAA